MKTQLFRIIILLSFSIFVHAKDFTLVEKDTIGKGYYFNSAISGTNLFVQVGNSTDIEVFNISDPNNIVQLPSISTPCVLHNISIDGSRLVAICSFSFYVFDISNINSIVQIGFYDSPGYAVNGLVLENDRIFMAGGNSDIVVFDATDLNNLIEISKTTLSGFNTVTVKKDGDIVYFVEYFDKVGIYDVTDASNVLRISEVNAIGTIFLDPEIVNNFLYIGTGQGLQVINITDRTSPVFVKNITLDSNSNSLGSIRKLKSNSSSIYGGTDRGGIYQFDLTDVETPNPVGFIESLTEQVESIQVAGSTVLLTTGVGGLSLYDFSNLNNISQTDSFSESIAPRDITIEAGRVVISDESSLYHLFDIDSELSLTPSTRLDISGSSSPATLLGDYLWLGNNNFLQTYLVTDFTSPSLTESIIVDGVNSGSITYSKREGNFLYVGTNTAEVRVYDVTSNLPVLLIETTLGADPVTSSYRGIVDIEPLGNHLLISTTQNDLNVIDITDTANPSLIFEQDWSTFDGSDRQLEVVGDRLYIARNNGLMMVDISNITTPTLLDINLDFGLLDAMQIVDANKMIVSGDKGLFLVDISTPETPVAIDNLPDIGRLQYLAEDSGSIVGSLTFKNRVKTVQINQRPVAQAQVETTNEDIDINGTLLVTDNENDALTFTVTQQPANGSLTINSDKSFVYSPNLNYFGSDSFSYDVFDFPDATDSQTVSITVNPVNDKPVITTTTLNGVEDIATNAQLVAFDAENDPVTFSLITAPTTGTMTVSSSGAVTYIAEPDFFGVINFQAQANDGIENGDIQDISIMISNVNDKPIITSNSFDLLEDVVFSSQITSTDVENDSVTYSVASQPSSGGLQLNANGDFTFTPELNNFGIVTFQVLANDGTEDSDLTLISLNISAVNDVVEITDQSFQLNEDTSLSSQLVFADVDGPSATVLLVQDASSGQLLLETTGSFTYTPDSNFNGVDTFQVKVNDGIEDSVTVTITLTIDAINDTPTVAPLTVTTDEDTLVSGQLLGSDIEGQSITFAVSQQPANGQVVVNSDGSFDYTPNANFNGMDSFDAIANDTESDGVSTTIEITVTAINDVPTTQNQTSTIQSGNTLSSSVSATDVDGDTLTFSLDSGVSNGVLNLSSSGTFTYTPSSGFTGVDSFTFTVADPDGESSSAQMTINVTAIPSSGGGGPVGYMFFLLLLLGAIVRNKKYM